VKYTTARVQMGNHAVEMVSVPKRGPVLAIQDGLILRAQPEYALSVRTKTVSISRAVVEVSAPSLYAHAKKISLVQLVKWVGPLPSRARKMFRKRKARLK